MDIIWKKFFSSFDFARETVVNFYKTGKLFNRIFLTVLSVSIFWMFFLSFLSHGNTIASLMLFQHNNNDIFADLFNLIYDVKDAIPYTNLHIYPPLMYMFLYPLGRLIPYYDMVNGPLALRFGRAGVFIGIVFTALTALFVVFLVLKLLKGTRAEKIIFSLTLILSAPFLFEYERGNTVNIVMIFLALFIMLKDSEKVTLRNFSYLCLAISAGIRLYPAVFGLLLLKEKRWNDAAKTVLFGILAFFLPFVFFQGTEGLLLFFRNFSQASDDYFKLGFGSRLNFSSTIGLFFSMLGFPGETIAQYTQYFAYLLIIPMLLSALWYKEYWKTLAILSLAMVYIPPFSFLYTGIFMLIPLIFFLNSNPERSILNWVYLACFIGIFVPITYVGDTPINWIVSNYPVSVGNIVARISIMIMTTLLLMEPVLSIHKERKTYSAKIRRLLLVGVGCAGLLVVLTATFGAYKIYQEVEKRYLTPINSLLGERGLSISDTNLVFAKYKWIHLLTQTSPRADAPDPSHWNAYEDYYEMLAYFRQTNTPFILDKGILARLEEVRIEHELYQNDSSYEAIFANNMAVDENGYFLLCIPKERRNTLIDPLISHDTPSVRWNRGTSVGIFNYSDKPVSTNIELKIKKRKPVGWSEEKYPYIYVSPNGYNYNFVANPYESQQIKVQALLEPGFNSFSIYSGYYELLIDHLEITVSQNEITDGIFAFLEAENIDLTNTTVFAKCPQVFDSIPVEQFDISETPDNFKILVIAYELQNSHKNVILDKHILMRIWKEKPNEALTILSRYEIKYYDNMYSYLEPSENQTVSNFQDIMMSQLLP